MNITRRSLLVSPVLAAFVAAVPDVIKSALAKAPGMSTTARGSFAVMFPRGSTIGFGGVQDTLVSTGAEWIPIDSVLGQAVLNELAVNLRSDGTLRHRQHHWPRPA